MIVKTGEVALASSREYSQEVAFSASQQMLGFGDALTGATTFQSLLEESSAEYQATGAVGESGDSQAITQGTLLDRFSAIQKKFFLTLQNLIKHHLGNSQSSSSTQETETEEPATTEEAPATETVEPQTSNFEISQMPLFSLQAEFTTLEMEHTEFSAGGYVETADGQRFDFDVMASMSRAEYTNTQTSIFMDPIVIQFDGTAADLQSEIFEFDINADGEVDKLSSLGAGSAFLSCDFNGDGTINDGSELFGALSGNGFADLAQYDEDGNGWIDEADSIYDKLSLWSPGGGENGEGELISARDAELGALYLGSSETEFTIREDGETLGVVRRSGVGLMESGEPVVVQQIDLAVRPTESAESA